MPRFTVVAVAAVSLAAGWLLGSVLPWWGTVLLVLGALAFVRARSVGRS